MLSNNELMLFHGTNKLFNEVDLEKVREHIKMTQLCTSLIKELKLEGKQENIIEIAKRAIKEGVSDELISKLTTENN